MSSPPAKIRKTENEEAMSTPLGGVLRNTFDISELSEQAMFRQEIGGVNWSFEVSKKIKDEEEYMFVELKYHGGLRSKPSIDLRAEYIIYSSDNTKNRSQTVNYTFQDPQSAGCYLLPWEEIMNEQNGFIEDDIIITVAVRLTILKGLRCNPIFDFSSGDALSDVILIVEGKPIHVNKHYLGIYSPVLRALFSSDNEQNEFELKDVFYEEFIDLLHVIYPSCKKINPLSAEYLITLSKRFQIACVFERVEDYYIHESGLCIIGQVEVANRYGMHRLLEHCLSSIKQTHDFKTIKAQHIYDGLSDATKVALFERMLEIAK